MVKDAFKPSRARDEAISAGENVQKPENVSVLDDIRIVFEKVLEFRASSAEDKSALFKQWFNEQYQNVKKAADQNEPTAKRGFFNLENGTSMKVGHILHPQFGRERIILKQARDDNTYSMTFLISEDKPYAFFAESREGDTTTYARALVSESNYANAEFKRTTVFDEKLNPQANDLQSPSTS